MLSLLAVAAPAHAARVWRGEAQAEEKAGGAGDHHRKEMLKKEGGKFKMNKMG